ncbi:MAG: 2OG-Fe(II) oxygenase [Gemmatimonadota bacterium]
MKQGGSVSYFDIRRAAPSTHALYHSPELIRWLSDVTGEQLLTCPESDPHACALYYYTQPGDYIGWHYDTSFYRGKRFTVLLGLIQRSSSELVCRVMEVGATTPREARIRTLPGTLVVLNDALHHCVTPNGEGEDRVVLSLEYVTDRRMGFFARMVSNVKDAVAYFGIRNLLRPLR